MFNSSINTVHSSSLTGSLYLKTIYISAKANISELDHCLCCTFSYCRKDDVKEEAKRGLRATQVHDKESADNDNSEEIVLPAFPELVSFVSQKVTNPKIKIEILISCSDAALIHAVGRS